MDKSRNPAGEHRGADGRGAVLDGRLGDRYLGDGACILVVESAACGRGGVGADDDAGAGDGYEGG